MYKDDLQYRTNEELEGLLEERQEEIEWIKAEMNNRNNVSAELLEYKEQLERIIKKATLPYIILKFDRNDTGPVVLIAQTNHIRPEVDGANYTNASQLYFSTTYCVTIYYSKDNEHCNITSYEDHVYDSDYINNVESFIPTFKDCFVGKDKAQQIIADAVSRSCLDYYADAKNDVRKALCLDFKSTLKIKAEYAEYML